MENGFASAWKLGLHRNIDYFQNPVFGDDFWGNLRSLFGIIAYVSASALVTSSKTPPKTVPKNFAFGKPFSQFGKGEPRLPLCFLIWGKEAEATSAVCCWGQIWGLSLRATTLGTTWATSAISLLGHPLWIPLWS